ncbi:PREDICTED: mediator of RNA polymerase II transcription subunit 22b-like isoform X2 [Nelumbo nucifera]|uniref:Mediator of RNA polymerase II transcription subunit 22b-like isoform X2 n=2 Tax=Nelumbo nucifera TaxID=4432 RepID=A0A1U7YQS2_NELNU|nr:PREDICTED: mediator of RNA polymerase II transcription subunit 22b-like isoform X2 [Nelumbo nucifera]DAD31213.1 TPA_asm: hypothetical protein HUJ06_010064 [Nelumbo nucifera]
MNKGVGVGVGGGVGVGLGGAGSGPTAAAAAAAAQKQKTLLQRVDTDITNIVDNFSHLVNVARVNDPPVKNSQEAFMMEMRAARMVYNQWTTASPKEKERKRKKRKKEKEKRTNFCVLFLGRKEHDVHHYT